MDTPWQEPALIYTIYTLGGIYTCEKGTVGVIIAVLVVSRAHTHACVLPAVSFEEKIVIILIC